MLIHRVGIDCDEGPPVPIPNTEVKLLSPMILLSGKVGYRRLYDQPRVNARGCSVFAPSPIRISKSLVSHMPGGSVSLDCIRSFDVLGDGAPCQMLDSSHRGDSV